MSLLGDTTFLDQLASSTSLLTDNIAKTDTSQIKGLFGNYSPNKASDYVNGIPQNQFVGNQFQLPYQPGEFTGFGGQFGSGGLNTPYTPGGYTPQPFNQYSNVPGGLPSNVTTTTTSDRGGRDSMGPGVSTEFVGNTGLRINEDGTVTKLDPTSLDYKFNSFMNNALKYTPSGLLSNALDPKTTFDLMKRVQDNYGVETAMKFRDTAFDTQNPATTDAVEGTGSGAVGSTGPTARSGRDNRGGVGNSNASQGSAAAGANRGGAPGARS